MSFAVFVAPSMRAHVIRAITAFEVAFDYLDSIVELPNPDPVLNSNTLCQALRSAFDPGLAHIDYYEHHTARDDGGYLVALVEACRMALARLPSYAVVAEPVCHSVSRIIIYQSLNHGDAFGSRDAFREWALSQSAPGIDLRWWELGAAMGSQLSILALIAAAADPTTSPSALQKSSTPTSRGLRLLALCSTAWSTSALTSSTLSGALSTTTVRPRSSPSDCGRLPLKLYAGLDRSSMLRITP